MAMPANRLPPIQAPPVFLPAEETIDSAPYEGRVWNLLTQEDATLLPTDHIAELLADFNALDEVDGEWRERFSHICVRQLLESPFVCKEDIQAYFELGGSYLQILNETKNIVQKSGSTAPSIFLAIRLRQILDVKEESPPSLMSRILSWGALFPQLLVAGQEAFEAVSANCIWNEVENAGNEWGGKHADALQDANQNFLAPKQLFEFFRMETEDGFNLLIELNEDERIFALLGQQLGQKLFFELLKTQDEWGNTVLHDASDEVFLTVAEQLEPDQMAELLKIENDEGIAPIDNG